MRDSIINLIITKLNLDIFVRFSVLIQTLGLILLVGLEFYGEYALWFATIVFVSSLILGVTSSGFTIYVSDSENKGINIIRKVDKRIKKAIIGYIGINILLIFLMVIIDANLVLLILSVNVFGFYVISGVYLAIFRGLLRIQEIAKIEGYSQIIGTFLILIQSFYLGFLGIVLATFLIYFMKTFLYNKRLRTILSSPDCSQEEEDNFKFVFKKIFVMSLPYGTASLMNSTTSWIGLLTLTTLFSSFEAGIFQASINFFSIFTFLTNATNFVLLPKVFKGDKENSSLNSTINNLLILSISVMGVLTSFVIYFFDLPTIVFVSLKGIEKISLTFLCLMFFSPITLGLITIFSEVFKGTYSNRTTTIFLEILWGTIYLSGVIMFVPNFGTVGLALCYSISNFIWFLAAIPFWKKNRKSQTNVLNPYHPRLLIQSLFYFIVEIVIFIFLKISSFYERVLLLPLFSIIIFSLFFSLLPKEIRKAIFNFINDFRKRLKWKVNH